MWYQDDYNKKFVTHTETWYYCSCGCWHLHTVDTDNKDQCTWTAHHEHVKETGVSVLALIQVSGLLHALAAFPTRHKNGAGFLSFCDKWFQSPAKTYSNYLLTFIKTPCFTKVYTTRKLIFYLITYGIVTYITIYVQLYIQTRIWINT
jgi:hypothetical protein